jgi:hypothetical protein
VQVMVGQVIDLRSGGAKRRDELAGGPPALQMSRESDRIQVNPIKVKVAAVRGAVFGFPFDCGLLDQVFRKAPGTGALQDAGALAGAPR